MIIFENFNTDFYTRSSMTLTIMTIFITFAIIFTIANSYTISDRNTSNLTKRDDLRWPGPPPGDVYDRQRWVDEEDRRRGRHVDGTVSEHSIHLWSWRWEEVTMTRSNQLIN